MKIIHPKVNIQDNSIVNGFIEVAKLLQQINSIDEAEIVVDCSQMQFVSPSFVIPFYQYINTLGKNVQLCNLPDYLQKIRINSPLKPDEQRDSEFLACMEEFTHKTFIPVVEFPSEEKYSDETNKIISTIESIIARQLQLSQNVVLGFKYLIGELVDNIIEHSGSSRGCIFAQTYKNKYYMDICISDTGIGLLGSYQKQPNNEIDSDVEAMQAANKGLSTKNLPDAENRGFGIYTSKKMLIDGFNGQYMMISGNAMYLKSIDQENIYSLPQSMRFSGTLVGLRIPYNNESFNYIKYIE